MASNSSKVKNMDPHKVVLNSSSPFTVQEAYKALRTNVIFSQTSEGCKIIGVTSSTRGEGKSTTAVNLAISFGSVGKKVLLIDGDLRLPTIAAKLGMSAPQGLSDVLVGEADVNSCIVTLNKHKIYALSAGSIPPDATKLLTSKQLRALMSSLRKYFEYIIIDLPPVTTVADAAIVADIVDGYILIAKHEQSDKKMISAMIDQLQRAEANILGFVYTGAPTSTKKHYGYYK